MALVDYTAASCKAWIRRVVRRAGYDILPLSHGLRKVRQEMLQRPITVLDVGANVGQYAEQLRSLGFRGTIISFEPNPAAFAVLEKRARRDAQWRCLNFALGDDVGAARLYIAGNSVSSSLLEMEAVHETAAPGSRTVGEATINLTTLREIASEIPSGPLFLKMDVQGYELQVLRGSYEILPRVSGIQAEVSFAALYANQTDWLELCAELRSNGFSICYMEPGYEDPITGQMLQADVLFVRA